MKIKNFSKINKQNKGYTIIETMIAVSLFLVIISIGLGALLNASLLNNKSQNMRSVLDSLSFIMEDISRNLRTGYNYRCYPNTAPWNQSYAQTSLIDDPQSCAIGRTIVFENSQVPGNPSSNSDQWIYKLELVSGSATDYNIYKSTAGGSASSWVQLNPPEVVFRGFSGFSVLGAESPSGSPADTLQPFVGIKLTGRIIFKNTLITTFSLQSSVSERLINI